MYGQCAILDGNGRCDDHSDCSSIGSIYSAACIEIEDAVDFSIFHTVWIFVGLFREFGAIGLVFRIYRYDQSDMAESVCVGIDIPATVYHVCLVED